MNAQHIGPILPPPTLALFDLDDTLCDYAAARGGRLRIAFRKALAHAPDVDLDALVAESIAAHPHGSDHFGDLLADHGVTDSRAVDAAWAWFHRNRFHGLALLPDAAETLDRVRAAMPGRRIGLITNGPADVQRAKIDMLGLEPHLDFALISGEFGVAKPDPAIFAEALRRGGADAGDAVVIGDSPEFDIAGAQASGIRAVWMNHAGLPWADGAPRPDREAGDLGEVRRLLGEMRDER